MAAIVKKGINSFKFFMAYKGALMVGDELLLDGMQRCRELGALAMVCLLPMQNTCCHYLCLLHSILAHTTFLAFMSMSCSLAFGDCQKAAIIWQWAIAMLEQYK